LVYVTYVQRRKFMSKFHMPYYPSTTHIQSSATYVRFYPSFPETLQG